METSDFSFQQYKDVLQRLTKFLNADIATELIDKFSLEENDLIFLGIGDKTETVSVNFRTYLFT